MPRRQHLAIRATAEQISLWEGVARWAVKGGDVGRFIALASDRLATYLLEELGEREKRDPIAQRIAEKKVLGALLKAAKRASRYVPDFVSCPVYGRLPVGLDLASAIKAVECFLQESGEEYPCP